jgi:hypothetical protein
VKNQRPVSKRAKRSALATLIRASDLEAGAAQVFEGAYYSDQIYARDFLVLVVTDPIERMQIKLALAAFFRNRTPTLVDTNIDTNEKPK